MLCIILWTCQHYYLPLTEMNGLLSYNDDNVRGEHGFYLTTSRAWFHPLLLSSSWALRIETGWHRTQVSPSLPDQLNGGSWGAKLSQHHVHSTFPHSWTCHFQVWEIWLGAHLLFSVRAECWVACSKLSSWYLCSSSILFLFRMLISGGSAFVAIKGNGRAPSPKLYAPTPPLSFPVSSPTLQSREDALTSTASPPPPTAYGLPSFILVFLISQSLWLSLEELQEKSFAKAVWSIPRTCRQFSPLAKVVNRTNSVLGNVPELR